MPRTAFRPTILAAVLALAATGPTLAAYPSPSILQLSADGTSASDVETANHAGSWRQPQSSPDAQWVVYVHDAEVDGATELWSVPRQGGPPVRLCAPLLSSVGINWFAITADSARVVYAVRQETVSQVELYSVPIAGPAGATVKLSPTGASFSNVYVGGTPPVVSPDGQWVVFMIDTLADDVPELWTAPTDGSAPAARVSRLNNGGAVSLGDLPQITADSTRVLFVGDLLSFGRRALWSAPLDGSALGIEISFRESNLSADVTSFRLTPDGSQVVFLDDREIAGRVELFRRPVTGGTGTGAQLSPVSTTSPTANGDVGSYVIAPDSSRVAFVADLQVDSRQDLWSVPLDGDSTDASIVSPAIVAGREAGSLAFSPDSARIAFNLDDATNNVHNLWSVGATGSPAAIRHNPALASTADVTSHRYTDDGARIVYRVDDQGASPAVARIWSVPSTQGFASAVQLSTTLTPTDSINQWAVAGDRVVMIGNLDGNGETRVYRAPANASTSRVVVYDPPSGRTVNIGTLLVGGGAIAYFRVDSASGDRLLDVPLDGSAAATSVDPVPGSGMGVLLAYPTPTGHGILIVGDYELQGRLDLWIADRPLLSNGFEPGGNGSFAFSP